MATRRVATARIAHDGRSMGWRADDHIRSGNRTTADPLIGYGRAILPTRRRRRQPQEYAVLAGLRAASSHRHSISGSSCSNIRPDRKVGSGRPAATRDPFTPVEAHRRTEERTRLTAPARVLMQSDE